ncbi:hypothetical protein [Pararhodobacter zhoushanensis]|uniref:hypothetical protein n=1 Tax=Pararhodobacter zhoushanensis TaxID=2479545 RepID=UPI000F8C97B2|nr:hypothetical protein [Pararhodobacter zhoushanensis]
METTETNRDRVRRLLFEPLGFRHPKKVAEAAGVAMLNAVADELSYMSDDNLAVLARMMRVHGEGSSRDFWPARAAFISFAHLCQPLPLEADTKLISWFASREGDQMVQDGTLVETWRYFEAKRIPPATPQARALVLDRARDAARRIAIVHERRDGGWGVDRAEAEFVRLYEGDQERMMKLLQDVRAAKAEAVQG